MLFSAVRSEVDVRECVVAKGLLHSVNHVVRLGPIVRCVCEVPPVGGSRTARAKAEVVAFVQARSLHLAALLALTNVHAKESFVFKACLGYYLRG